MQYAEAQSAEPAGVRPTGAAPAGSVVGPRPTTGAKAEAAPTNRPSGAVLMRLHRVMDRADSVSEPLAGEHSRFLVLEAYSKIVPLSVVRSRLPLVGCRRR